MSSTFVHTQFLMKYSFKNGNKSIKNGSIKMLLRYAKIVMGKHATFEGIPIYNIAGAVRTNFVS
jgi:hypothetical protein